MGSLYECFDTNPIKTYPLRKRSNKVSLEGFVDCEKLRNSPIVYSSENLEALAEATVDAYRKGCPVLVISGAHPIKNGLSPIIIDLMERGIVTFYATNGAGSIHAFELALTGASSEDVRSALPIGEFGMAFETGAYLNFAIREGDKRGMGYGEAMGRLYEDAGFRKTVLDAVFAVHKDTGEYIKPYGGFKYAHSCIFARAFRLRIPTTVHAMMGTDIIDQHPSFNGCAKGGTSGRDFLIFVQEIAKFNNGGVLLNIGSAVMGPEVTLKAVSMAANIGKPPKGIVIADFDIRPFVFDDEARDESQYYYYLRDQKSIATRIPKVFGGQGYYIEADHADSIPAFYQYIMRKL